MHRLTLLSPPPGRAQALIFWKHRGADGACVRASAAPLLALFEQRCAAADVAVDIVRVGVLKGGGPPFGLDASYYDTLRIGGYPTPSFATAQQYDKLTLGVSVSAAEGVEPRSSLARSASKTDATPQRDECSRVVAAQAMLACLRSPELVHVSLSAKRADAPPADGEWDALLAAAASP